MRGTVRVVNITTNVFIQRLQTVFCHVFDVINVFISTSTFYISGYTATATGCYGYRAHVARQRLIYSRHWNAQMKQRTKEKRKSDLSGRCEVEMG